MRMTVTSMLLIGGGVLLVWSGVTDRHPVEVLRAIFTGQPIPERGSWSGGSGGTQGSGGSQSGGVNV